MEFREDDREVNRIRYKVDINGGTIGSVRGALWQGKEVDISIQDIVDAEVDGGVPSPQSSPRQVHSFLCPPSQRTFSRTPWPGCVASPDVQSVGSHARRTSEGSVDVELARTTSGW
jgi:hypothetical protein